MLSPFARAALLTVPLALIQEVAYLDLGHELTYFGQVPSQTSMLIRYTITVAAAVSVVCALAFRTARREI